ncbi:hypothetical protein V7139_05390 [Neobacillus drentensis]
MERSIKDASFLIAWGCSHDRQPHDGIHSASLMGAFLHNEYE